MARWVLKKEGLLAGVFSDLASGLKSGWRAGNAVRSINPPTTSTIKARTLRNAAQREAEETRELYEDVKRLYDASPFADPEAADKFMARIAVEAFERAERPIEMPLAIGFVETARGLLEWDGLLFGFPHIDWSRPLGLEEGVRLRNYLHNKWRVIDDHEYVTDVWREKIIRIFEGILGYLPDDALIDEDVDAHEHQDLAFQTPFLDRMSDPHEVVERLIVTMFDSDVVDAKLFDPVRERLDTNLLVASGINPADRDRSTRSIILPTSAIRKTPREIVELYLAQTPFEGLFAATLSFGIPLSVRFEHCHIVGGTGHGKTQLLQTLVHADLSKVQTDGCSLIVIVRRQMI